MICYGLWIPFFNAAKEIMSFIMKGEGRRGRGLGMIEGYGEGKQWGGQG